MKDHIKESHRWFLQAENDFKFVMWVHQEDMFYDKGCFIAQQAGEKALKACLYATGERKVWGHSLFEMIQQLQEKGEPLEKVSDVAKRLDRFYITARYPNGLPGSTPFQTYSKEDLSEACNDLEMLFTSAKKFLREKHVLR